MAWTCQPLFLNFTSWLLRKNLCHRIKKEGLEWARLCLKSACMFKTCHKNVSFQKETKTCLLFRAYFCSQNQNGAKGLQDSILFFICNSKLRGNPSRGKVEWSFVTYFIQKFAILLLCWLEGKKLASRNSRGAQIFDVLFFLCDIVIIVFSRSFKLIFFQRLSGKSGLSIILHCALKLYYISFLFQL